MERTRRLGWPLAVLAVALVATAGIAYSAIPGSGGVIHTCYTKSSGSWRVIDADVNPTCKSNEASLALYSKDGAEAAFLATGAKAADSEKLDGLDSGDLLGVEDTAADADRLGGLEPFRYAQGQSVVIVTDYVPVFDGGTGVHAFSAEDSYPGMRFEFECDVDAPWTIAVTSPETFDWWWDDSFGSATLSGSSYVAVLDVGQGLQRHAFRASSQPSHHTTLYDLDTAVRDNTCVVGVTLTRSANDSPGHP